MSTSDPELNNALDNWGRLTQMFFGPAFNCLLCRRVVPRGVYKDPHICEDCAGKAYDMLPQSYWDGMDMHRDAEQWRIDRARSTGYYSI